tara:strand:+ start:1554 stop:5099 length:3546 start_codon:yes stop_codon:yes gene_type:complete
MADNNTIQDENVQVADLGPIKIEPKVKSKEEITTFGDVQNLTDLNKLLQSKGFKHTPDLERLEEAYNVYVKGGKDKVPPNSDFLGLSYSEFLEVFDDVGITKDVEVFKERHGDDPFYRDLNDVQLADKVYEQLNNSALNVGQKNGYGNFVDYVNKFSPKPQFVLDTNLGSGFERDRRKKIAELAGEDIETYNTKEVMQELGLDSDRKSISLLTAKSFGRDKQEGIKFLDNFAKDVYGPNTILSFDPRFDSLSLFKADGSKSIIGKPDKLDVSDFSQYLGDALPVVTDAVFSSGAYVAAGGVPFVGGLLAPLASGATSGFIVPAMESVKFSIGYSFFGGKDSKEDFEKAYKDRFGADSFSEVDAYITGGIDVLRQVGKTVGSPITKLTLGPFKKQKVGMKDIEGSIGDLGAKNPLAQGTIDEVVNAVARLQLKLNEKKGLGNLRLNLGQLLGNQKFLGRAEDILKKPNKYGDSYGRLIDNQAQTDKALLNILNDSKNGFIPDALRLDASSSVHKSYLEDFITKTYNSAGYKNLNKLQDDLILNETSLLKETKEISGSFIEKGTEIQNAITFLDKKAYNQSRTLYDQLEVLAKGYNVNTNTIQKTLKEILNASKSLSTKAQKQHAGKNFIDLAKVETADDLIKNLKAFRKQRKMGDFRLVTDDLLDKYENAVVKQLKNSLRSQPGGSGVVTLMRKADDQYKAYKQKFPKFVKNLIDKNNGNMPDGSNFFTKTFKVTPDNTGRQNMDRIYNIIKDDPTAVKNYQESIGSFYKSKVLSEVDGKIVFDKKAHTKFIKDYDYGIKKFFGKEGFERVSKINGIADELKVIRTEHDKIFKEFEQLSPNAKAFNPQEIYKFYREGDLTNFKKSINLIKKSKNPDMLDSLKAIVADDILATIKPVGEGAEWQYKNFNKLLDGLDNPGVTPAKGSKAELLKTLYGGKGDIKGKAYLQNLKDMKLVLNRRSLKGAVDEDPVLGTSAKNLLRAWIAPPLSRAGRVMTGALGFAQSGFDRGLAELIVDPDALAKLAKLRNIDVNNPKFGEILQDTLDLPLTWDKKTIKFLEEEGKRIYKGTKKEVFGFPFNAPKQGSKDFIKERGTDTIKEEDVDSYKSQKLKNSSSKLSRAPINVAQMNMPQPQTTNVASAPNNNPQGIAALSPGQGSGTTAPGSNAQTIDRMAQVGLPLFNRG